MASNDHAINLALQETQKAALVKTAKLALESLERPDVKADRKAVYQTGVLDGMSFTILGWGGSMTGSLKCFSKSTRMVKGQMEVIGYLTEQVYTWGGTVQYERAV